MDWLEQAKTEVGGIVDVPAGKSGRWEVRRWTQTEEMALNSMFQFKERLIPKGEYTGLLQHPVSRLLQGSQPTVYMSDTPAELSDHYELMRHAHGNILVMGLGIGVIMEMVMTRVSHRLIDDLSSITFVEKNPDVIKLVAPHYEAKYPELFRVIEADALTITPEEVEEITGVSQWNAVWHDIWASSNSENAEEYQALLDVWALQSDWQGAWQQEEVMQSDEEWIGDWILGGFVD